MKYKKLNKLESSALFEGNKISKDAVRILIEEVIEIESPYICQAAAKLIGEIGTKDAIPSLLNLAVDDLASNDFSRVQLTVVDSLTQIASREGTSILFEFVEAPQHRTRATINYVLSRIASEIEIPFLINLIKCTSYSDVLISSVETLGRIFSERFVDDMSYKQTIVPVLLKLLKKPDSKVRGSLAITLGHMDSNTAIPGLIKLLSDPISDVRKKAGFSLILIAKKQAKALAHYRLDPWWCRKLF